MDSTAGGGDTCVACGVRTSLVVGGSRGVGGCSGGGMSGGGMSGGGVGDTRVGCLVGVLDRIG